MRQMFIAQCAANLGRVVGLTATIGAAGCGDAASGSDDDDRGKALDVVTYAQHCEEEIGPLPAFNCPDGDLVPNRRTLPDGTVIDLTYEYLSSGGEGGGDADCVACIEGGGGKACADKCEDPDCKACVEGAGGKGCLDRCDGGAEANTCDSPVQILNGVSEHGICLPNSRLMKASGKNSRGEDYDWVSICRHFDLRPAEEYVYDEIGTIGYNKKTGATCFLAGRPTDFSQDGKSYTAKLMGRDRPTPADPDFSQHYAIPGDGGCVRCHNADPWILNPYISRVIGENGQLKKALTHNRRGAPFQVVDGEELQAMVGQAPPRDGTSHVLDPSVAPKCTTCHDIGNRYICSRFVPAAFEANDGAHDWTKQWRAFVSPAVQSQRLEGAAWHLPLLPELRNSKTREELYARFTANYGESYQAVLDCCDREDDPKCKWKTIVGESEPVGPIKHGGVRFYWYQAEGDSQPDFDPRRDKVAIFIHGWHKADKNAQVVIDLQFKTLVSGGKDYGKELQLQGYNVGVIDWFEVARTDKVGDAERGVWNPQFAEDLQLAYRDGMQQISDAADEQGLDPQVRVMGHSLGAQVASALVGKLSGAVVSRKVWPDRVAFLDPYFSKPLDCAPSSGLPCVGGKLTTSVLAQQKLERWRDETGGLGSVEVYASDHSLSEIIGDEGRPLLQSVAYEELVPSADLGPEGGLFWWDWVFDWQNQRHHYPIYWYFKTLVHHYNPVGGISAWSSSAEIRGATGDGTPNATYFAQSVGDGDISVSNDDFVCRRWSDNAIVDCAGAGENSGSDDDPANAECLVCIESGGGKACAPKCAGAECQACVAGGGGKACAAKCGGEAPAPDPTPTGDADCVMCIEGGGGKACAAKCEDPTCKVCVENGGGKGCLPKCGG